MKNTIALLMLLVVSIVLQAQPKPAVKPGTPVVPGTPAKPKTSPYVLKKDYDEMLLTLDAKVKSATSSNASLRNLIGSKDREISSLKSKMENVEEILNSTAFKVSNTSDSLNKTRFSVEEFRKSTEEKFVSIDESIAKNSSNIMMMFGIGIIVSIILFVVLLLQLGKLKKSMLSHNINAEIKLHEILNEMTEKNQAELEKLKVSLERDDKVLNHSLTRSISEEKERINFEVEKITASIEAMSNDLTSLKNKA